MNKGQNGAKFSLVGSKLSDMADDTSPSLRASGRTGILQPLQQGELHAPHIQTGPLYCELSRTCLTVYPRPGDPLPLDIIPITQVIHVEPVDDDKYIGWAFKIICNDGTKLFVTRMSAEERSRWIENILKAKGMNSPSVPLQEWFHVPGLSSTPSFTSAASALPSSSIHSHEDAIGGALDFLQATVAKVQKTAITSMLESMNQRGTVMNQASEFNALAGMLESLDKQPHPSSLGPISASEILNESRLSEMQSFLRPSTRGLASPPPPDRSRLEMSALGSPGGFTGLDTEFWRTLSIKDVDVYSNGIASVGAQSQTPHSVRNQSTSAATKALYRNAASAGPDSATFSTSTKRSTQQQRPTTPSSTHAFGRSTTPTSTPSTTRPKSPAPSVASSGSRGSFPLHPRSTRASRARSQSPSRSFVSCFGKTVPVETVLPPPGQGRNGGGNGSSLGSIAARVAVKSGTTPGSPTSTKSSSGAKTQKSGTKVPKNSSDNFSDTSSIASGGGRQNRLVLNLFELDSSTNLDTSGYFGQHTSSPEISSGNESPLRMKPNARGSTTMAPKSQLLSPRAPTSQNELTGPFVGPWETTQETVTATQKLSQGTPAANQPPVFSMAIAALKSILQQNPGIDLSTLDVSPSIAELIRSEMSRTQSGSGKVNPPPSRGSSRPSTPAPPLPLTSSSSKPVPPPPTRQTPTLPTPQSSPPTVTQLPPSIKSVKSTTQVVHGSNSPVQQAASPSPTRSHFPIKTTTSSSSTTSMSAPLPPPPTIDPSTKLQQTPSPLPPLTAEQSSTAAVTTPRSTSRSRPPRDVSPNIYQRSFRDRLKVEEDNREGTGKDSMVANAILAAAREGIAQKFKYDSEGSMNRFRDLFGVGSSSGDEDQTIPPRASPAFVLDSAPKQEEEKKEKVDPAAKILSSIGLPPEFTSLNDVLMNTTTTKKEVATIASAISQSPAGNKPETGGWAIGAKSDEANEDQSLKQLEEELAQQKQRELLRQQEMDIALLRQKEAELESLRIKLLESVAATPTPSLFGEPLKPPPMATNTTLPPVPSLPSATAPAQSAPQKVDAPSEIRTQDVASSAPSTPAVAPGKETSPQEVSQQKPTTESAAQQPSAPPTATQHVVPNPAEASTTTTSAAAVAVTNDQLSTGVHNKFRTDRRATIIGAALAQQFASGGMHKPPPKIGHDPSSSADQPKQEATPINSAPPPPSEKAQTLLSSFSQDQLDGLAALGVNIHALNSGVANAPKVPSQTVEAQPQSQPPSISQPSAIPEPPKTSPSPAPATIGQQQPAQMNSIPSAAPTTSVAPVTVDQQFLQSQQMPALVAPILPTLQPQMSNEVLLMQATRQQPMPMMDQTSPTYQHPSSQPFPALPSPPMNATSFPPQNFMPQMMAYPPQTFARPLSPTQLPAATAGGVMGGPFGMPVAASGFAPQMAAPSSPVLLQNAQRLLVHQIQPQSPSMAGGEPLPEGWVQLSSRDGKPFFFNTLTKKSTWERPRKEPTSSVEPPKVENPNLNSQVSGSDSQPSLSPATSSSQQSINELKKDEAVTTSAPAQPIATVSDQQPTAPTELSSLMATPSSTLPDGQPSQPPQPASPRPQQVMPVWSPASPQIKPSSTLSPGAPPPMPTMPKPIVPPISMPPSSPTATSPYSSRLLPNASTRSLSPASRKPDPSVLRMFAQGTRK